MHKLYKQKYHCESFGIFYALKGKKMDFNKKTQDFTKKF